MDLKIYGGNEEGWPGLDSKIETPCQNLIGTYAPILLSVNKEFEPMLFCNLDVLA